MRFGGLPWWAKVAGKLVLSRLPIPARMWQRLGLFRHGAMDDPDYAARVFFSHHRRVGSPDLDGATVVELGPGNSIASAVVASALGARCILVDAGPFATLEIESYRELAQLLRERGHRAPDLSDATDLQDVLRRCDAEYHTDGIASLRRLPPASVDFVFSQAVLEHVRRDEFEESIELLARALRTDGTASHRVDLKDHLGGALNNLRFRSSVWESSVFRNAGFYTNRLALSEMDDVFNRFHASVETTIRTEWARAPLERSRLAPEFRSRSEADLMVSGFDVVLRGPTGTTRV
jgi:SAM-dependent methyltransferase